MKSLLDALLGDWHVAVYSALKTVVLFVTAAVVFRLTQRRALAQFTPFDWVTAVAAGAVIGRCATAPTASWLTGAAALATLFGLHALVEHLRFVPRLRRLVDPDIQVLIRDGHVDQRALRRCGMTSADLAEALRQHGQRSPDGVKLAVFEQRGSASVLTGKG